MRTQRHKRRTAKLVPKERPHPAPAEAAAELERQRIEEEQCPCCRLAECIGGCGRLVRIETMLICSACEASAVAGRWSQ